LSGENPIRIGIRNSINHRFIILMSLLRLNWHQCPSVCIDGALPLHSGEFEMVLLEAVDWGLSSLGETPKQAMYFHLENSFGVRKEEIPYKVEAFVGAVEEIFGLGAGFLENLILRRLCDKVGGHFDWDLSNGSEFVRCVAKARRVFRRRETHTHVESMGRYGGTLVKTRVLGPLRVYGKRDEGR
jgi:hypothetical protein